MDDRGVVRKPYRAVVRLYAVAGAHWRIIDGTHPGVDLIRLPPRRFCNVVYTWAIRNITKEEDLAQFDYHLYEEPLPWEKVQKIPTLTTEVDDDGAQFLSVMSSLKG